MQLQRNSIRYAPCSLRSYTQFSLMCKIYKGKNSDISGCEQ